MIRRIRKLLQDNGLSGSDGIVRLGNTGGWNLGMGTTVPADGTVGWAPGALFMDVDAAAEARIFVNDGTKSSSAFANFEIASGMAMTDTGVAFTTDTVGDALTEISVDITSTQKCLFPYVTLEEDGTALTTWGAGATPGWQQLSNKEVVLAWDGNASPTGVVWNFILPNDVDATADISVHWLAAMAGLTDTPTITHECYFNSGDTDCAGTDDVVDGGTTITEYTATIAAANVPASPSHLTIVGAPTGTMTTDELHIFGTWIEYKGKLLTA